MPPEMPSKVRRNWNRIRNINFWSKLMIIYWGKRYSTKRKETRTHKLLDSIKKVEVGIDTGIH
jgi:hypothetical protein